MNNKENSSEDMVIALKLFNQLSQEEKLQILAYLDDLIVKQNKSEEGSLKEQITNIN